MNILMLTESHFPADVRIRQEAYKLMEHGHRVSVIAIKNKEEPHFETIKGVKIYRVPKIELFKKGKQAKSENASLLNRISLLIMATLGYGFEFFYFTAACFFLSLFVLFKDRFHVIHTHNPPDTLFSVALLYKMIGKKFVYDHHDLSPDLFTEKYGSRGRFIYNILRLLERSSCQTADLIIATNESYKRIEVERCHVKPEKIYVVRNGPDFNEMKIVEPIGTIKAKAKTIICYLGAINTQDGVDNLIFMLAEIVSQHNYKDVCFMILGDGDYLYEIKRLAEEQKISEYVFFTGYVSDRNELNRYMSTADIFVDAAPASFLNDNSTFIKHMEYMVYEKPVVSFALKESMYSLKDAGVFVRPNDIKKMAKVVVELVKDETRRKELGSKGKERVKDLCWDKVSIPLIQAYETLRNKSSSAVS